MLPEIIPNWHPIFVHFTIALLSISTLLLILGSFAKLSYKEKLLSASYINLWLGCVLTIATIAAGFYAYNTVNHDAPSHAAMTSHKNWAIPTAILFWFIGLWSIKLYKKDDKTNKIFMLAMVSASVMLLITGLKGGEAVYRYGLGVMSLPKSEDHGHGGTKNADSSPNKIENNKKMEPSTGHNEQKTPENKEKLDTHSGH